MENGKDSDVSLVGVEEETNPQEDAGTKEGAESSIAPMKSESPQCTEQDANTNGGSKVKRPAQWSTVKHSTRTCIQATGVSFVCAFVSVFSDPACPALSDLVDASVRLILS